MQSECEELQCVLMTFPAQLSGDCLPARPAPKATIVYLGASLEQGEKEFTPLLGSEPLHQHLAFSEPISSIAKWKWILS